MKKSVFAVGALLLSGAAWASQDGHWEYSGKAGPENWAKSAPITSPVPAGINRPSI